MSLVTVSRVRCHVVLILSICSATSTPAFSCTLRAQSVNRVPLHTTERKEYRSSAASFVSSTSINTSWLEAYLARACRSVSTASSGGAPPAYLVFLNQLLFFWCERRQPKRFTRSPGLTVTKVRFLGTQNVQNVEKTKIVS